MRLRGHYAREGWGIVFDEFRPVVAMRQMSQVVHSFTVHQNGRRMRRLSIHLRFFVTFLQGAEVSQTEMASTNQHIVDRPGQTNTDVSRREVGKVAWKNVINELVDSEKEDLEDLRILRRRLTNADDLRLVAQLFDRKA